MDKFDKETRSRIMSAIHSKNTKIELKVFKALRTKGIRFRQHYKKVLGTPDIAIPQVKKAVFIDGDFWHGFRFPLWKGRLKQKFWIEKIERNRKRDAVYHRTLRRMGWKVLRIWEHQLESDFDGIVKIAVSFLRGNKNS